MIRSRLHRWCSLLVIITIVTISTTGCVRVAHSDFVRSGKALRVNEPVYDLRAVKLIDGTVNISFIGTPTLRTSGKYVKYVEAAVGADENSMNDIITFSLSTAGAPGVGETIHLTGNATWDTKPAVASKSCWADVSVVTPEEHLVFRTHLTYEVIEPLELTAFSHAVNDTTMEIGAVAKRIFVPPGEYLPSSEVFRIIITDEAGTVVYRSDYERNFLQFVSTVEPQTPNQMQRYVIPWNGRNLQGVRVSDGDYHVELLIPAHPKPYRTDLNISWPPR